MAMAMASRAQVASADSGRRSAGAAPERCGRDVPVDGAHTRRAYSSASLLLLMLLLLSRVWAGVNPGIGDGEPSLTKKVT
jgi:hypothetical protein